MPQDLADLLQQLENRLNHLVDETPLVALRAAGIVERTGRQVGHEGPHAALAQESAGISWWL